MQESNSNFFRLLLFVLIFTYVYTIHKILKLHLKFEILNVNKDFFLILIMILFSYFSAFTLLTILTFLLLTQLFNTTHTIHNANSKIIMIYMYYFYQ